MVWNGNVSMATQRLVLGTVIASICFAFSVAAQSTNDITLSLESTTARPGDSIEVTLSMTVEGETPTSMIVFLAYDAAALTPKTDEYELILRNSVTGEPILDDSGNAMAIRRAVRPFDAVLEADKTIDSEVHSAQGVVVISITGLNMVEIPDTALLSVAFTVAASLEDGATTTIVGLNDENAIGIPDGSGGVVAASTSASRSVEGGADAVAVTYGFEDAEIMIGCVPPAQPTNISATQNRSDGVLIGWSRVATAGAEYRVYRNTVNNAATAISLGATWESGTSFLDISAQVPVAEMSEGCALPAPAVEVHYFYWVRARSVSGCQGDLSATSAEGFRTAAKVQAAGLFPAQGRSFSAFITYGVLLALLFIGGRGGVYGMSSRRG